MNFNELNLNKQLLNALQDLELSTPTTIQAKVFSVVMSGKNVCAIAQTGTGKTFAYLLPCLRQFQYSKSRAPQLMIIVPTRELVTQVVEQVEKLSKYLTLEVVGVYGGVNMKSQSEQIMDGLDVIVGTPGRMIDLLAAGVLKPHGIKKLVIDEFDEMLNLGFRTQLKNIFDRLPERRQNLLFSATLSDEVEKLMDEYFYDLVRIEATPIGTPLANIDQTYYTVPNFYTKINLIQSLLNTNADLKKVLVFTSTKHLADLVHEALSEKYGDDIQVIHSNKSQPFRFAAVQAFKDGDSRVLIATDIIARGIDVAEVTHVINFDIPPVPENYIHRIGRTGRVGRKGIAISFVNEKEQPYLTEIEQLMNFEVPKTELPEGLEISTKTISEEEPHVHMKNIPFKSTLHKNAGSAFQEKSAKNRKVNKKRDYAAEMRKKYGKSYEKPKPKRK